MKKLSMILATFFYAYTSLAAASTPEFVLEDLDEAADIIAYLPIAKSKGLITTEPKSLEKTIRTYGHFTEFNEGKTTINELITGIGPDINFDLRSFLESMINTPSVEEKFAKLRRIYEGFVRNLNSNADLIRLCSNEARQAAHKHAQEIGLHDDDDE